MNRTKGIIYAVLGIVGIVGASATAEKNQQGGIYHRTSPTNFVQLSLDDRGEPGGWECESAEEVTCTYTKRNPSGLTVASNMTRSEEGEYQDIPE